MRPIEDELNLFFFSLLSEACHFFSEVVEKALIFYTCKKHILTEVQDRYCRRFYSDRSISSTGREQWTVRLLEDSYALDIQIIMAAVELSDQGQLEYYKTYINVCVNHLITMLLFHTKAMKDLEPFSNFWKNLKCFDFGQCTTDIRRSPS